ncbi:dihydrofolate reductase [Limnobacter sp.]|uniref:dihydrofolate reductase n=1 Tax=Limnobacter sp. TaxID=2003368 RepID=UPI003519C0B8
MKVSLVAAVASNGVIGINNSLPWRLPEDLALFKKTTLGCPVLMGRKTYESINRPLPGRLNVVVSTNAQWQPAPAADGTPRPLVHYPHPLPAGDQTAVALAPSLEAAIAWLQQFPQVFLIGGSNLYQQALQGQWVDELVITEIHHAFEGDAHFPTWSREQFKEIQRLPNPATAERAWTFDFVKYGRIQELKDKE